jgi:uncharacterized protein YndB with AHSA1/START domain
MKTDLKKKVDYRFPTASKWLTPRAVVDAAAGIIIATGQISASPNQIFSAFTTDEVGRWWGHPDYYRWTDWKADLRVGGHRSVKVVLISGGNNGGRGEFAVLEEPNKIFMTRRFDEHPLLGNRETTITYRMNPTENGTFLTLRDEGFIGKSEAAFGNAEHWERVLSWLETYFKQKNKN